MARATWMPPIASCALYRHQPPLVSASSPYTREPPITGLAFGSSAPTMPPVVAGPVFPPPFLLLLPHAAATITSIRTSAIARGPRQLLRVTVPPDSRGALAP